MTPEHLFLKCLEFVREQSAGEWGDAVEAADAGKMAAFISGLPLQSDAAVIAGLREVLERSAEGWSNALELGLIPERHRVAAKILRDEAREALAPPVLGGAE